MRFYFHLVNGCEAILDDTGIEVPDLETAKSEAMRTVRELRQEDDVAAEEWPGWQLNVVCAEGILLYSLNLTTWLH